MAAVEEDFCASAFALGDERFDAGLALWRDDGPHLGAITEGAADGMSNARPVGVPRNSFDGQGYVDLDLNLTHDFPLTKQGDKGPTATLSLNSFNVLNHVNDMTYIGVVGSRFFGHAVAAQPPRRMQLDIEFRF